MLHISHKNHMENHCPITQIQTPPGFIDLGIGDPPFALLPLDLLRQAAEACFARADPAILQYGAEQGNGYFRRALAAYLSKGFDLPVEPPNLFTTTGASSALDLLCTLYTKPGDVIFVEEPSYFLALRIFADHGLEVVSIQTDRDGLVIDALQEELKSRLPKLLYIIPTFQNPTGHTLSHPRRRQLADLSREYKFMVIADEVYHLLQYGSPPPEPMASYIDRGNIISISSFSKILAPGLRLGWIQANNKIIQRLVTCGLLDSGGGMNPFTSAILREILENGKLAENITRLRSVYSKRLAAMDGSLRRHLPQVEYHLPQGGYFFWVRIPGVDTLTLQDKARTFKVGFRPGVRFSSQGGMKEYIRLGFVFYDEDTFEQGIIRLRKCLQNKI